MEKSEHPVMDNLLKSKTGENEVIRVVFKKTVNTGQYETEVFEADTSIEVDKGITGIERMIISHVLLGELEYGVLLKLVLKGKITKQDMDRAISETEHGTKLLYEKAMALGIKPKVEKYINGLEW